MSVAFYTLDVGHGLCQVICFGERAILIDGGGRIGKRVAEDFLTRYIRVIVAYIATHNDADHVAAAPELLDAYPTAATLNSIWLLLDRPASKRGQTDEDVITMLGYSERRERDGTINKRHALYVDDKIDGPTILHREDAEDAELQLLYPKALDVSAAVIRGAPDPVATNQASAILRLVIGGTKSRAAALITGDANCQSFQMAREKYKLDIGARVISVPHHGGEIPRPKGAPTWDAIVGWIAPEIAVVSAGYGNVPQSTTTKRDTFAPLRKSSITTCCTEITKHCHSAFKGLAPSVTPMSTRSLPQLAEREPKAVACAGTIAVEFGPNGEATMVGRDQHQKAIDDKVAGSPGCPHCR